MTTDKMVDVATFLLWAGVAFYFGYRYFRVTHKMVTLSLCAMALSCACVGLLNSFFDVQSLNSVLRIVLLANAIFVVVSLVQVSAEEKARERADADEEKHNGT